MIDHSRDNEPIVYDNDHLGGSDHEDVEKPLPHHGRLRRAGLPRPGFSLTDNWSSIEELNVDEQKEDSTDNVAIDDGDDLVWTQYLAETTGVIIPMGQGIDHDMQIRVFARGDD
ncbi:Uu.00g134330.m01.CDS01 [Anthostomella pinea]|uniref:Uu.00g134330.m01.CDS01 n=1 Tax=Anthostomella pinea TaxID=933095 RepID=A0AAI8VPK9_9PEZI|nr:Uu.00g134330.m01.CDS01 [Anthostomella pinea]